MGRWHLLRLRAARAQLTGDFTAAMEHADAALEVAHQLQDPTAVAMHAGFMAHLRHCTGVDAEFAERLPEGLSGLPPQYDGIKAAVVSMAHLDAGDPDRARAWFDRLRARLPGLPRSRSWVQTVTLSAELAVLLGDTGTTRVCHRLLAPYAGYYANYFTACYGSIDRVLGLLAAAHGEHDLADRHLAAAVAMEERIAARPALAQARLAHARALSARGGPGDRNRALSAADRAGRTARELGMAPLATAAATLVDELSGIRGGVAALTPREREIAGLVAQGLTNRVIAQRLVLSERTVETHVRNLMAKLVLSNRTQVAAWAVRAGLRTPSQRQH